MGALVCDLCGGKLIMGAGGIATCESCGMEHSVDRMKEKVQEIQGTVRVDNSHMINNYFSMIENALDAGNNEEAEDYCNKIIEIDPYNYRAWFFKGKAVGWQSTLGNQRVSETVNAFSMALDSAPEEVKEDLSEECKNELKELYKALLTVRMNNFMKSPNQNDISELLNDIKNILLNTMNFFAKSGESTDILGKDLGFIILSHVIGGYKSIVADYVGDDGKPSDYQFRNFIDETDICIKALEHGALTLFGSNEEDDDLNEHKAVTYDTMVTLNTKACEACSWDYNYSDGMKRYFKNLQLTDNAQRVRKQQNSEWQRKAAALRSIKQKREEAERAEKERIAKEAAKKRFDDYWIEHSDEKVALETEKDELNEQITKLTVFLNEQIETLNQEIAEIPGKTEITNMEDHILLLTQQRSTLGIFKGKEKKALQEQINKITTEKDALQDRMNMSKKEIESKIAAVQSDIQKQISSLQRRINNIVTELTKER